MRTVLLGRWVNAVLLAVVALLIPVSAAQASAPATAVTAPAFGNPFDGCKEAPKPAKPLSPVGLSPSVKRDADPFWDKGVTIESVYGNGYSFFNYDNGCKPGSGVMPRIASEFGNIGLRTPAAFSSMGHGLQSAVISPGWLEDMDEVVVDATESAKQSVWAPWAGISIMLVGVLMMWLSRTGRLDGTITTGAWALIVLTLVTFLGNYPKEAAGLVDDTVRSAAVAVADGFSGEKTTSKSGQDRASQALERQWDQISRETSYRTWLEGTFGNADSATAKKYGPRTFKATHLSWSEYEKVTDDPDGEGKKVLERKAKEFEEVAEDVSDEDPYAYAFFTGNEWGHKAGMSLLGVAAAFFSMFLVTVASVGMAIGLILVRMLVVFSPAMGVIFLFEPTREWALALLGRVGKWVVLGPVLLFAGLVVLRMNSAVASNDDSPLWMRLLGMGLISLLAWWLVRPMAGVPKLHVGRKAMGLIRMAVLGVTAGAASGAAAKKAEDEEQSTAPTAPAGKSASQQRGHSASQPVAMPPAPTYAALPPGTYQDESNDLGEIQTTPVRFRSDPVRPTQRTARDLSALPAGTVEGRAGSRVVDDRHALPPAPDMAEGSAPRSQVSGEDYAGPQGAIEPAGPDTSSRVVEVGTYHAVGRFEPEAEPDPGPSSSAVPGGLVDVDADRPSSRPDPAPTEGQEPPVAPVEASSASGRLLDTEEDLPESISEANVTYGEDGSPVYVVYRPEGSVTYRVE